MALNGSIAKLFRSIGQGKHSNSLSGLILFLALAGPPLFYGSRQSTVIAGWCLLLGLGLVFSSPSRLGRGHFVALAGLGIVTLCFAFVLHEQLSDNPWIAAFNPIWAKASEVLGRQLVPSVSIVRGEPFFALGPPLSNMLAVLLGIVVGTNPNRAVRGIKVMAGAGAVYAIYGIVALVFDPTEILWREKTAYVGSLTSTFINRNTAAAYFGSCAVAWLVLLSESFRRALPRGPIQWKSVPGHLVDRPHHKLFFRLAMLMICILALILTNSRAGVLISLAILTLTFLVYFRRDLPRGKSVILPLSTSVALGLVLFDLFAGNIRGRIHIEGLIDEGRLAAYHSTLNIIADNPWFGTGLGTFAFSFPAYRSSAISMQGVWDLAHSTHLEFASEMGIPLTIVVGIAWIAAGCKLALSLRNRARDVTAQLSALMVSALAMLHSTIDFSLQISGYSIVVFAVLGLGLSQSLIGIPLQSGDYRQTRFEAP